MTESRQLADRIRAAYEERDPAQLEPLLADDVRWGDDDHPNRCRSRADVLRTFSQALGRGVTADVLAVDSGPRGVRCRLHVNWADPARGVELVHVLLVRDDLITEIRRYDDGESAAEAIGVAQPAP